MKDNNSQRIAYWDNLKAILIFLVVLGHFLLPVSPKTGVVFSVYTWIYLFHMPAFVFVSGYFAKRYVDKGATDEKKLIGFLVLYVLFSAAIWIIRMIYNHDISMIFLFTASGAPWYLLCMFMWYCLIPHCAKVRPIAMITVSITVGLLVGLEWQAGSFLALSRFFVFFPFFLFGYHFDFLWIKNAKPFLKIISAILLILVFILICLFPHFFASHTKVIYGDSAYTNMVWGLIERFIWYITAGILVSAFLFVIPQKRYFFTYIGQRTLAIYILHRLMRDICQYLGFYEMFSSSGPITFIACFIISIIITVVFSTKKITELFSVAFSMEYRFLLKK